MAPDRHKKFQFFGSRSMKRMDFFFNLYGTWPSIKYRLSSKREIMCESGQELRSLRDMKN